MYQTHVYNLCILKSIFRNIVVLIKLCMSSVGNYLMERHPELPLSGPGVGFVMYYSNHCSNVKLCLCQIDIEMK